MGGVGVGGGVSVCRKGCRRSGEDVRRSRKGKRRSVGVGEKRGM